MKYSWRKFFPFKTPRQNQIDAIEFALDAFSKKKFVVLELGTGVGKSAIGVTLARLIGSTYFLTTQKILQDQYMRDFGPDNGGQMRLLKSSSNYCCQLHETDKEPTSCSEINSLLKSKAPCACIYSVCKKYCKFTQAKIEFEKSDESITNYAYFLTSTMFGGGIKSRNLLVCDEAHCIEQQITSLVTISFSNLFYKKILKINAPEKNATQEEVYQWLKETCIPSIRSLKKTKKQELDKLLPIASNYSLISSLTKEIEVLTNQQKRINFFLKVYNPVEWIFQLKNSNNVIHYEFKPVTVTKFANSLLFDRVQNVLLMSATILDKKVFCNSLGVNEDDVEFLRIPSTFPAKNRPILITPVGSMSFAKISNTLPNLVEMIKTLLETHKDEKGIIHTVNYNITNYIIEHIKSPRLISHISSKSANAIKQHMSSNEQTVLVSPSMMEGVDLYDDNSRFQIICKIPFLNLSDLAVKKHMTIDKNWYNYQTVKALIQAIGRSIRSETDHATTYILDSDWKMFYKMNKRFFTKEFVEAIQNLNS